MDAIGRRLVIGLSVVIFLFLYVASLVLAVSRGVFHRDVY